MSKKVITLDPSFYKIKRGISGLGLFATKDIKKGDYIIEYIGIVKSNKEDFKETQYLFEVNKKFTIDGSPRWNTARYINHSCKTGNAESEIKNSRVYIKATKNISLGDEITYDYGEEFFNQFIKPYGCRCGTCSIV